jgi:hypothetical protein
MFARVAATAGFGAPARYMRRALLRAAVFESPGADHERWTHRPATAATVVTGRADRGDPARHRGPGRRMANGSSPSHRARSAGSGRGCRRPRCASGTRSSSASRTRTGAPRPAARRQASPSASGPGSAGSPARSSRWRARTRSPRRYRAARPRARARRDSRGVAAPVQVRFPRLAPGYLIDVIGTRRQGYLLAVAPATAQPPYLAAHPPAPPLISGQFAAPSAAPRSGTSRATSRPACWASAMPRLTRRPTAAAPTQAPPARPSPACSCRTCRSAARCGSGTSAPTGRPCSRDELQRERAAVLRPVRRLRHVAQGDGWRT